VKTLTRKSGSSSQLIRYILRYINSEKKTFSKNGLGSPLLIRHNIRGKRIEEIIAEFKANESRRIHKRSNQPIIHHTIISFNSLDSHCITDQMLMDIAKKYISYKKNNLYIGAIHKDRRHLHIHIACSATQLSGLANRISKYEFEVLKVNLQEYQLEKYPNLIHSLPKHTTSKERQRQNSTTQEIERFKKEMESIRNIRSRGREIEVREI
jgi:hypothetical protein